MPRDTTRKGEYDGFLTRMRELFEITHLNTNNGESDQPPDEEHTTGHFWNLNFHERHEGALHFWCRFFTRGGKGVRPRQSYRVLPDDGPAQCFCVGLRFHKCHLQELLAQDKVTFFNRHYSQYSIATTTLDYTPGAEPQGLTGEDRHGRALYFRTEEILDSIVVN